MKAVFMAILIEKRQKRIDGLKDHLNTVVFFTGVGELQQVWNTSTSIFLLQIPDC
jgi:hypothetical protein